MRRLRYQAGFSLIEVVTTLAIIGILAAIVTGQFSGQQGDAKMKADLGQIDQAAAGAVSWAAGQQNFTDGSRLTGMKVSQLASAASGKFISQTAAASEWVRGTQIDSTPSDDRTMVFTDTTLDGERIRLTRCREYFDQAGKLCARVDIFPWGNETEGAPTLVYRYLQCVGAGCANNQVYAGEDCKKWPVPLPESGSPPAASGPACVSATSASVPIAGASDDPTDPNEAVAAPGLTVPPATDPPAVTSAPSVSGLTATGAELTADRGSWANSPTSYSYQWQVRSSPSSSWTSASGQSNSTKYTLPDQYSGHYLRIKVTAVNSVGQSSAYSSSTDQITSAPACQEPSLSGSSTVGSTKTSEVSCSGSPAPTVTFQWQVSSDGSTWDDLSGSTAASLELTASHSGKLIRLKVTATNSADSQTVYSPSTARINEAPSNTSIPTISGSAEVSKELTASPGQWRGYPDPDFAYRWQLCNSVGESCDDIQGATSSSYWPSASQAAKTLRVKVTASNTTGQDTAYSEVTAQTVLKPDNTSLPVISGDVEVGKTLTASSGDWDAFPSPSYSYQWRRCNLAGNACSDISSATNSSYAFDSVDSELSVRVVVTATNSGGSSSATSAAVSENDQAPVNTSLPSFSGTAKVGEALTGAVGVWSGYPAPTYAYQWQSCDLGGVNCSDITGYTSPTFLIPAAQASWRIRLKIIASNRANASVAAYSSPSDAVVRPPFNDSIPEISGTVKVGQTISSSQGQWSGYPTPTYSYQWQVASDSSGEWTSATGIGNSSSSYVVDEADAGKFLRIQVTAQNSQDTVSAYSQTTSAASWLPANISLPVVSGDAQSGATLTSTSGSWTGFPSPSFSTMWQSQSQAVAITGGGYNTCALRSDGTVWCWGQGAYGAIGIGSVADRWTPTQVSGISTATSISGAYGGNSFCAVLADTTAKCWGYNPSGILGDGTTTNRSTPVTVAGLSGVKAIETVFGERSQACAVKLDGTVWCWGAATYGQLDGTLGPASLTPVQVRGIDNAEGITIGTGHTCSNLSDGTVWCWGASYTGSLGGTREDFTSANGATPVRVIGVNDALSVSANYYSTCAALSSGKVKCWGNNGKRQSGDNRQAVQNTSPYLLPTLTDVKSLKGANQTQCAVLNSGQVACWGQNNNGQLGDSTLVDNAVPQIVPGISSAVGAFGGGHSCALLSSGEIKCWGGVYLGNNTGSSSLTPVTVNSLAGAWTDSSPSSSYLLPASKSGSVVRSAVTAANAAGSTLAYSAQTDRIDQIASNSVAPSISGSMSSGSTLTAQAGTWSGRPAPSYAYKWQTQDRPTEVRTALGQSCSLRSDGTVWCWGLGSNGILGWGSALGEVWQASKVAAVSSATKLSMGVSSSSTACVLLSDKTVKCWGMGTSGQLGNGALLSSPAAVTVTGLSDAVDISTGTSSCAVKTDGTVWCWGANSQGQLGDGTTTTQSSPVQVVGISSAISVSTGNFHTCALLASLTVKCWGYGNYGQLGNSASANSSTPVTVTGLSGVKSISSGQYFSCALLSSGSVKCWGYGLNGRLGNGAAANSNIPVTVLDESSSAISATQMLVGFSNVCAVLTSGKVGCWGQGAKIDVGDSSLLAEAPGISSALQVSAGSPFCSLLVDRSIKCWGTDQYGSLGAGTSNNYRSAPLMPVEVNDFSSSWTAAASGSSYQSQAGDNGKFLRVKVTASNQAGSRSVFSDPAAQVTAAPNNSVLPTIFGEVKVGLTVTASPGFWTWTGSVSPAYSYQWQIASSSSGPWTSASGSGNSSSSYLLTSAESSKFLRVRITAQNPDGTAFAYSDVSSVAALPPTNTVAPVIVGGTTPGSTLTASTGTWTGSPTAYSYQWQRCDLNGSQCTSIGSDSSTYTLVNADAAYTIKVQVTGSNVAGSASASSALTSAIASASGCTVTTSGLYTIHTCTTVGSSAINTYRTLSADYLVVGGGGGASTGSAGGGGGGGVRQGTWPTLTSGAYAAAVGAGGNKGGNYFATPYTSQDLATVGGNSSMNGLIAGGGGFSGAQNAPASQPTAHTGSGGGGGGGTNQPSQQTAGAAGSNGLATAGAAGVQNVRGGGGGGASAAGSGVSGGAGYTSPITGSAVVYGSGGGAGVPSGTPGVGGSGAGNGGLSNTQAATDAVANRGGGGGGGGNTLAPHFAYGESGNGGSGVVIVRYLTAAAPVNTALPTVSGAVNNGSVLAGYAGTWTGEPTPTLTYQWQVAAAATGATWTSATGSGATSLNYTVASADAGKYLRLTVTGTSTSGITSASSAASAMATDPPVSATVPSIAGTATVGSTLTSDSGTWTGATPISYAYQWQRQATTIQVSPGSDFVCALRDDGTVWCWGDNASGQLGDGTTTTRLVPTQVSGITGATEISSGSSTACAVVSGAAKCWGSGSQGKLGNGTTTGIQTTPVQVTGLTSGVTSIDTQNSASCAIVSGAAKCWGFGQLGDGQLSATSLVPVQVSGLTSGVTSITTSGGFSCAVQSGAAKCWGSNGNGQLGDGTSGNTTTTPGSVSGLTTGVASISSSESSTCAVTSAGAAWCWGYGGNGLLGNGTTTGIQTTPVQVTGLTSGVTSISGSNSTVCAVQSGAAKCWGYGSQGQLGNGTTTSIQTTPVQVTGLTSGMLSTSSAGSTSCVVSAAGAYSCFGSNTFGQLGNGTISYVPAPASDTYTRASYYNGGCGNTSVTTGFTLFTTPASSNNVYVPVSYKKYDCVASGTYAQGAALATYIGGADSSTPVAVNTTWVSATGAGATTASYVPAASDAGKTLRSQVTASNSYGSAVAYSTGTSVNVAPVNTVVPVIAGTLTPGQTLTASTGTWTGSPTPVYSHQWQRCDLLGSQCTNVGTNSSSYTLVNADAAYTIKLQVNGSNAAGSVAASSTATSVIASASGCTVTTSGGYTIHSCATTGSSTLNTYRTLSSDYLVIAGGGGGGGTIAGGGGGGGMLEGSASLASGTSYTASVGGGGTGALGWNNAPAVGTNGSNSAISGAGLTTITSLGGGGGGSYGCGVQTGGGLVGGSGGGGGSCANITGAAGTASQGNAGGNGAGDSNAAGGGGGAGGAGVSATASAAGRGGAGRSSSIAGTATLYGGGGGGGVRSGTAPGTVGAAGTGGGGLGNALDTTLAASNINGTNGLGGGGGGCGHNGGSANRCGGNGGSGVVIVRYLTAAAPATTYPPKIPSIANKGVTLTGTAGTWTGEPTPTLTYQWQVSTNGSTGWSSATGSGATALSYIPASADVGQYLRLTVTGTSTSGITAASSAASSMVTDKPINTVVPAVSGVANIGSTLTSDSGTWTGAAPIGYAYQWQVAQTNYSALVLADSPAGYWELSEASGTTIADSSGNSRSATLSGTASYRNAGPSLPGKAYAMGFTGASTLTPPATQAHTAANTAFNGTTTISDEVWFKASASDITPQTIMRRGNMHFLALENGVVSFWAAVPGWTPLSSTVTGLDDSKWHHLVGTYDGSNMKIYVDGSLSGTLAASGGIALDSATSYGISIGATQSGVWSFRGDLAQIATYPSTLSAAQVANHYASGWANATGAGATTASYVPAASDSGKTLRSQVTASNSYGSTVAYSTGTSVNAAPVNSVVPVIAGTTTPGQTLTATSGTWTGSPTPTYAYQWQRCDLNGTQCTNVGTNASTYTLVNADAGQRLKAVVTASNVAGSASAQNYSQTVASASGCTVTTSGGYTIHSCTTTGSNTLNTYRTLSADYLVVGGGGSTGRYGGGGGGGGVLSGTTSIAAGATAITVGAGGTGLVGGNDTGQRGTSGGDSVFSSLTAVGGGAGGGYGNSNVGASSSAGLPGGSGGGGAPSVCSPCTMAGGAGTASQGNAGGSSQGQYGSYNGGGGGGAGQVGVAGTSTGKGGDGVSSSISGVAANYGGGGSGSQVSGILAGGSGGGGSGFAAGATGSTAVDGTANTGGGAGSPRDNSISGTVRGGNGGSGVVVVRYKTAAAPANTVAPSISGTVSSGNVLTGTAGTWTGEPIPTLTYQWQVASAATGATWTAATGAGNTSLSYTVTSADIGQYLRLTVTGTSTSGIASATATITSLDYPTWAGPLGSEGLNPSGSITTAVAAGPGGSSYITGYLLFNSVTFGSTTLIGKGGQDAFVAKVNADGSYAWVKQIGGPGTDQGRDIAVDSSGNAYITGFTQSALNNVAGQTTGLPALIGLQDAFVVKLDSTGAYSYAKFVGGTGSDEGRAIAVDSSGNAYIGGQNPAALTNVAGQTTGLPALIGGQDTFVVKLGSTGTYSYAKAVGGSGTDTGRSIAVDPSGNAYITGDNRAALTNVAGQTTGLPAYIGGSQDAFVVKLDSTGTYSYAKVLGGSGADQGYAIAVDSAGNAYITGDNTTALTNVAGTTTGLPALIGGQDAFVVKLDSTGTYSYAKVLGGSGADRGYAIAVDSAGNAYITGDNSAALTNVAGTTTGLPAALGSWDAYVVKLDNTGAYSYAKVLGGSGTDAGYGIAVDASNVYLAGTVGENLTNVAGQTLSLTTGGSSGFWARLSTAGTYAAAALALDNQSTSEASSVAAGPNGTSYITGTFKGNMMCGATQLTSIGTQDAFVAKVGADGRCAWAKQIGGAGADLGRGIAVDVSGNAYVTGYSLGALTNVAGTTTGLPAALGSWDAYVVKLDSAGAYSYAKLIGGAGNDQGYEIAVDASNNVYITGFQGGLTNVAGQTTGLPAFIGASADAFVVKLDSAGAYSYAKALGGAGNDYGFGIAVDSSNNAYVTGYNTAALTNVAGQTAGLPALIGGQDAFVVKLDSSGTYSYSKLIAGSGTDTGRGIAVDVVGNAYITGYNTTALTNVADQTTGLPALIGGQDAFVVKLDNAGAYSYSKLIGGTSADTGVGIAVDVSGNAYITGSIQGWSKVADQTTGLPANFGQSDAYVVKLDSAGAYSYSKLLGGYYQDYGYGIALLPNGSVLAAGQANRGLNLTFASKTWNVYSDSFFLSRLQPDGSFAY